MNLGLNSSRINNFCGCDNYLPVHNLCGSSKIKNKHEDSPLDFNLHMNVLINKNNKKSNLNEKKKESQNSNKENFDSNEFSLKKEKSKPEKQDLFVKKKEINSPKYFQNQKNEENSKLVFTPKAENTNTQNAYKNTLKSFDELENASYLEFKFLQKSYLLSNLSELLNSMTIGKFLQALKDRRHLERKILEDGEVIEFGLIVRYLKTIAEKMKLLDSTLFSALDMLLVYFNQSMITQFSLNDSICILLIMSKFNENYGENKVINEEKNGNSNTYFFMSFFEGKITKTEILFFEKYFLELMSFRLLRVTVFDFFEIFAGVLKFEQRYFKIGVQILKICSEKVQFYNFDKSHFAFAVCVCLQEDHELPRFYLTMNLEDEEFLKFSFWGNEKQVLLMAQKKGYNSEKWKFTFEKRATMEVVNIIRVWLKEFVENQNIESLMDIESN